MAKAKSNTVKVEAAKSIEHVSDLVGGIGRNQRSLQDIERRMNEQLAKIKERYEEEAKPFTDAILRDFALVQGYADAHKFELCDERSKTAKLTTGRLFWRTSPPKVAVKDVAGTIERLKRLNLDQLVRTKEEINKQAILAEPELVKDVKGISVTQTETFHVEPFESAIAFPKLESVSEKEAA